MAIEESKEDLVFFATPAAFGHWLRENHARAKAVWVGFHKKRTGKPTLTWPQSVDEALCWGWIDGIRKTVDADAYKIRFTPRKASSHWSAINVERVAVLSGEGRMRKPGLDAFAKRRDENTGLYSHELKEDQTLTAAFAKKLKANRKASAFFESRPPHYRKAASRWVMTAKREETRISRLAILIADSAAGRTIAPLTRKPPKKA